MKTRSMLLVAVSAAGLTAMADLYEVQFSLSTVVDQAKKTITLKGVYDTSVEGKYSFWVGNTALKNVEFATANEITYGKGKAGMNAQLAWGDLENPDGALVAAGLGTAKSISGKVAGTYLGQPASGTWKIKLNTRKSFESLDKGAMDIAANLAAKAKAKEYLDGGSSTLKEQLAAAEATLKDVQAKADAAVAAAKADADAAVAAAQAQAEVYSNAMETVKAELEDAGKMTAIKSSVVEQYQTAAAHYIDATNRLANTQAALNTDPADLSNAVAQAEADYAAATNAAEQAWDKAALLNGWTYQDLDWEIENATDFYAQVTNAEYRVGYIADLSNDVEVAEADYVAATNDLKVAQDALAATKKELADANAALNAADKDTEAWVELKYTTIPALEADVAEQDAFIITNLTVAVTDAETAVTEAKQDLVDALAGKDITDLEEEIAKLRADREDAYVKYRAATNAQKDDALDDAEKADEAVNAAQEKLDTLKANLVAYETGPEAYTEAIKETKKQIAQYEAAIAEFTANLEAIKGLATQLGLTLDPIPGAEL